MPGMMQAPVLDRRIKLIAQVSTGAKGKLNTPITVPVEYTVWAARKDQYHRETFTTEVQTGHYESVYTIRYRPDINTSWQVVEDGVRFGIENIRQVGRRRYLEVECISNKV